MLTYRRQWCHISTSQGACVALQCLRFIVEPPLIFTGGHTAKKKEEKTKCLVLFIRGTDFFFFFSVSSSKGGRNGDGCRSYRLSILSVEPCVKEKQVFFLLFFFFAAFILSALCCCSVWDRQVLIMRLCVSSSAHTCIQYIHTYNTVTPRHNATKPPILCLTVMPWMQKQQQPYGLT